MQRQAAHVPVEREECAAGGQNGAARRLQREADEARPAENDLGAALRIDADDAAVAAVGRGHIKIQVAIERDTLRTPQPAEKCRDLAALRDAENAVEARGRRSRDVKISARMKRQMISGDRRLERREDKNFALLADFENRSA